MKKYLLQNLRNDYLSGSVKEIQSDFWHKVKFLFLGLRGAYIAIILIFLSYNLCLHTLLYTNTPIFCSLEKLTTKVTAVEDILLIR